MLDTPAQALNRCFGIDVELDHEGPIPRQR